MKAEQLTAELMALPRPEIIAWARERGVTVIHLTHYAKKHLVAYVVRQAQQRAQAADAGRRRGREDTRACRA